MGGSRVGHVRIEKLLGEGGMGAVYLGFDEKLERPVAVKVLSAERRFKPEAKARFMREARLLSRLDDPRICRIYDLVEDGDTDFLVLEYIDGVDLAQAARAAESQTELLARFLGIAQALTIAHRENIVHRDLKPDNVMVTTNGEVKILDFGIARSMTARVVAEPTGTVRTVPAPGRLDGDDEIDEPGLGPTRSMAGDLVSEAEEAGVTTLLTRAGSLVGTIRYMSPEQASGAEITEATDLYSLGVMMQELLTGAAVYGESSGMDLLLKVYRADTAPITGLDPEVARLVEDLTRIDPASRPSAEVVADRLHHILDQPNRQRRRRIRLAVTAAVVIGAVVAAAMVFHARFMARRQAELAQSFARQGEEIAWRIRAEHLSPAHDLRPAIAEMRARMEGLKARMEELGEPATGPGHAALGRGFLALGDFSAARRHLEAAAEAGFRSPETDFALGITIGNQFGEELGKARRISDSGQREAEVERLNRQLRDPALVHLEASLESPTTYPGYVRALIALHGQRYDEALREVNEVTAAAPWFYEAAMLKGEINNQWAVAMGIDDRNLEAERRLMLDAAAAFSEAAATARSYPRARTRLCGMKTRLIENSLIAQDGRLGEADVDAAFAICQEALDLDPEEVQALVMQSGLSALRARLDAMAGDDPGPSFTAARDLADRAIALDPDLVVAHNMAGWVRFWSAQTAFFEDGADPTAELERAIENFTAVKHLTPTDPNVDIYLGDSYWMVASYVFSTGGDPAKWLAGGFKVVENAWQLRPGNPSVAVTLANLLMAEVRVLAAHGEDVSDRLARAVSVCESIVENSDQPGDYLQLVDTQVLAAEVSLRVGKDPTAKLDAAQVAVDRAVELSPGYFLPHMWRGWVGSLRAAAGEAISGNPGPAAEQAIADFERSLSLAPDQYTSRMGIGGIHLLLARHRLESGRNAASRLGLARRFVEEAVEMRPGFGDLRRLHGELELLEGRQRILDGGSPVSAFAAADEALGLALETGYDDARTLCLKSEVELWRARWRRARGEPTTEILARGLTLVGEALSMNPRAGDAELIRGELELELAGIQGDAAAADEARLRARKAFQQAVAANPYLERRVPAGGP